MTIRQSQTRTLQAAATAVLMTGLVLAVLQLTLSVRRAGSFDQIPPGDFLPVFGLLLGGVGFALPVYGLAWLLGRQQSESQRLNESLGDLAQSIQQLRTRMEELAVGAKTRPTSPPPLHEQAGEGQNPSHVDDAVLKRIFDTLDEIHRCSPMTESQRQELLRQRQLEQKQSGLRNFEGHCRKQQWALAEELLVKLESAYRNDPEVIQARAQFTTTRSAAESQALRDTQTQVRDLVAIEAWDQALAAANAFVENYPSNVEGHRLLERIAHERDLFRHSTVQKMYDDVKYEIERKQWRRALAGAQRLFEQFPDHHRAHKIRDQLRTIQDNAEIEERQEMEQRIQELIRSRRFTEAIEMAEDLIRRFPDSPQADLLDELLPPLRERAIQEEADSISRF